VALSQPKAVNLSAGQAFAVDVRHPTDPIAPPQLYASFGDFLSTGVKENPAALLSSDPVLLPSECTATSAPGANWGAASGRHRQFATGGLA